MSGCGVARDDLLALGELNLVGPRLLKSVVFVREPVAGVVGNPGVECNEPEGVEGSLGVGIPDCSGVEHEH
jgi:hypothetical protein